MNCHSFESVVDDLAREQMMEATLRDAAIRHSSNCESCAARLNDQQQLTVGLRQLASASHAIKTSPELQEKLIVEFRNQQLSSIPLSRLLPHHSRTRSVAAYKRYAAVAAALLIVSVAGAIYLRGTPEQADPRMTTQVTSTGSTVTGGPGVSSVVEPAVSITPRSPIRSRRAGKRMSLPRDLNRQKATTVAPEELVASNGDREITTEFIPIGYSGAPTVQDGGQVVRVELPRSTMARFGLPVNMERYDERVKADLWLGADGFARAIRFVQ